MGDPEVPDDDDIKKIRRNLMAASCLLVFLSHYRGQIHKLSILGNDIQMSGVAILAVVIVFWAYCALRYCQALCEVEDDRWSRAVSRHYKRLEFRWLKGEALRAKVVLPHDIATGEFFRRGRDDNGKFIFTFRTGGNKDGELLVAKDRMLGLLRRARFWAIWTSTYSTDYIFPGVFAGSCLLYFLLKLASP